MIIIRTPKSTIIRIGKCEIILTETSKDVPNGPYVVRSENGDIFGVSKLFDDQYEAFIGGSVKSNGGSFKWLGIEVSLHRLSHALPMTKKAELHSCTIKTLLRSHSYTTTIRCKSKYQKALLVGSDWLHLATFCCQGYY